MRVPKNVRITQREKRAMEIRFCRWWTKVKTLLAENGVSAVGQLNTFINAWDDCEYFNIEILCGGQREVEMAKVLLSDRVRELSHKYLELDIRRVLCQ